MDFASGIGPIPWRCCNPEIAGFLVLAVAPGARSAAAEANLAQLRHRDDPALASLREPSFATPAAGEAAEGLRKEHEAKKAARQQMLDAAALPELLS